jgi:hypothetical protein
MATRPKGFYPKGNVKSVDAVAKAKARASFTPRGLASMVVNAVLDAPAGRVGKVAKFAGRTGAKIIAERKGAAILAEKAARTGKISKVAARREAEKAAGKKAKGPGGSPRLTKNSKPLNRATKSEKTVVVQRTGGKPGEFKNVETFNKKRGVAPERVSTATEKEARAKVVTVKKMTAAEKTAAKNSSDPSGYKAARANREAAKPNTPGRKAPRASKLVRRARTVDQLGKSSASKIEKKIVAKKEAKLEARKNRANRPALIAKNKAAVKQSGERRLAEKARQTAETRLLNDRTPVKQYDDKGRVIGSTTKGELRQLKIKTDRAAKDTRNSLRGKSQRTIDERTPRAKELTDKEVEILRTVGKRDYRAGEVNPLAQKTVQRESDDMVSKALNDPRIKAQDAAREKAAIEKVMKDKTISRSIKQAPKKTFRGKAK